MKKRMLYAGLAAGLCFLFAGSILAEEEGLVGYWKFDEGEGNIVKDSSGEGNDGIIKGELAWGKGKAGNALQFDGEGDYVESNYVLIGDRPSLNMGTNDFTIEAWIKPTIYNKINTIVSKGAWGGEEGRYTFGLKNNSGEIQYAETGATARGSKVSDGVWSHIAVVKKAGESKVYFYINGAFDTSHMVAQNNLGNNEPFKIGVDKYSFHWFKGFIDELRIYRRALSPEEIKTHYELQKGERIVFLSPTTIPPRIDGYLKDPCWEKATKAGSFLLNTGTGSAPVQTKVYFTYDKKNLYLGYLLNEPKMDSIKAKILEDGGDVYLDDCAEFFLDTNYDRKTYYHFMVNSLGIKMEGDGKDYGWNGKWFVKTSRGKDNWTAEIAIPLESLNIKSPIEEGSIWGINLCRERRAGEKPEYSSLAYVGSAFHTPDRFGTFIFGNYLSNLKLSLRKMELKKSIATFKREIAKVTPTPFVNKIKQNIGNLGKEADSYIEKLSSLKDINRSNWIILSLEEETLAKKLKEIKRDMLFTKEKYIVWQEKNPYSYFTEDSLPEESQVVNSLKTNCCINGYTPLSFLITASSEEAVALEVNIKGLRSGRNFFPLNRINIQRVDYVYQNWNGEMVPDALVKTSKIVILPGKTKGIWLTIHTKDVKSGNYKGKLILISKNKRKELSLNLNVLPVTLPDRLPIGFSAFDDTMHVRLEGDMETHIKDLSEHYINVFAMSCAGDQNWRRPPAYLTCDTEGNIIKKGDFSHFDEKLELIKKYGGGKLLVTQMFNIKRVRQLFNNHLEYMSPAWKKAFRFHMNHLLAYLKAKSFHRDDIVLWYFDEPGLSKTHDLLAKAGHFLQETTPEIPILVNMTNHTTIEEVKGVDPYTDIWAETMKVKGYSTLGMPALRKRHEVLAKIGKPIWLTGPHIDWRPLKECYSRYRLQPWLAWKLNAQGMMFYVYNRLYHPYNHDGNIYGATWVKGRVGSALHFDGKDSYVADSGLDLRPIEALTVEAWINPSSLSQSRIIDQDSYSLSVEGGRIKFVGKGSVTGPALPLNTWSHVVGTFDGRYTKIYINGVLKDTHDYGQATSITYTFGGGNLFYIGRWWGCRPMKNFFHGIIDEVKVYKRALSIEEIKTSYEKGGKGLSIRISDEKDLVGYWSFDEGKGKIAKNSLSTRDPRIFIVGGDEAGVIYPIKKGVISSRRWEAFREGCQDYLCLYLLEQEIKKAEKSGGKKKTEKAKALLKEAVRKVLDNYEDIALASQYRERIINKIVELKN